MSKRFDPHFGKTLAGLRKRRGRSQKYLALTAGLDPSQLAAIERGRRPPPQESLLRRLMDALKASDEEQKELRRARVLTWMAGIMGAMDPAYGGALVRIGVGMLGCSRDELRALETLVAGLERRGAGKKEETTT